MGRLYSLQVVRALAALAVLQTHIAFTVTGRYGVGAAGVDVFFVLSGYIVSEAARRTPEGFLRNRLLRIYPPYAFAGLMAAISAAQGLTWQKSLSSLTLWPAYDHVVWPYLAVAWSLCYETLFYVALWLVIRVRPVLLLIAWLICWRWAFIVDFAPLKFLGSPIVLEFVAGTLLARVPGRLSTGLLALAAGTLGLALGAALVSPDWIDLQPVSDPAAWARVAAWGAPAVLLVYGAIHCEPLVRGPWGRIWARPLVFLGDASYSLYLFHVLIAVLADVVAKRAFGHEIPPWPLAAVCVAGSAGLYLGFERPLLKILRERFAPRADHARTAQALT